MGSEKELFLASIFSVMHFALSVYNKRDSQISCIPYWRNNAQLYAMHDHKLLMKNISKPVMFYFGQDAACVDSAAAH